MVIKKELTLYERDEKNELIPQEVTLLLSEDDSERYPELVGETIKIIPMKRGKIKSMFGLDGKDTDKKPDTNRDEDGELIVEFCKYPQYTIEELAFAKPVVIRSIVRTIFAESGILLDAKSGTKKFNDEFGKN